MTDILKTALFGLGNPGEGSEVAQGWLQMEVLC